MRPRWPLRSSQATGRTHAHTATRKTENQRPTPRIGGNPKRARPAHPIPTLQRPRHRKPPWRIRTSYIPPPGEEAQMRMLPGWCLARHRGSPRRHPPRQDARAHAPARMRNQEHSGTKRPPAAGARPQDPPQGAVPAKRAGHHVARRAGRARVRHQGGGIPPGDHNYTTITPHLRRAPTRHRRDAHGINARNQSRRRHEPRALAQPPQSPGGARAL